MTLRSHQNAPQLIPLHKESPMAKFPKQDQVSGIPESSLPACEAPPEKCPGGYRLPMGGEHYIRGSVRYRLRAMREYREWASERGLNHLVVSKDEVESLLRSWGHGPELANLAFQP